MSPQFESMKGMVGELMKYEESGELYFLNSSECDPRR